MLNKDDTLLEELISDENLKLAKQKVKKNKGTSGVDGMEVKELDEYLSKHLEEIKEQIRNKKYKPKPVKRVEIPKTDGGVRKREAWMLAISQKAYARCASSFLNNVLTNKRLKEKGLVSLLD